MPSNRSRRTARYVKGDRVIVTDRYRGAVGASIHGCAGSVHKVSYRNGGKFIWVRLDTESVLQIVLCFADELDREPTQEERVEAWAQDPEGKALVQSILDRKITPPPAAGPEVAVSGPLVLAAEPTGYTDSGTPIHQFAPVLPTPGPLYHSRPGRTYLPREEGTV